MGDSKTTAIAALVSRDHKDVNNLIEFFPAARRKSAINSLPHRAKGLPRTQNAL
jgi:hypothetical protein